MRPLNSTTLTVAITLLLAASTSCLALMFWKGFPLLWISLAFAFFAVAVLVFLCGWVVPRVFAGRGCEAEDQDDGVATNQTRTFKAEANFTRDSDGGISFETSLSSTPRKDPTEKIRKTRGQAV